ncbi:MAG: ester cyclase [Chthoniobacteraceae bacterium]
MKFSRYAIPFVQLAVLIWTVVLGVPSRGAAPDNEAIIRRYFDGWANHADTRVADELIVPDLVMHHGEVKSEGLEPFKQSMAGFHTIFPDLHFAIEDLIANQDKVLVRWLMTGTQRGEYLGQPPSGKSLRVTGMSLFQIAGGKIAEIWVNMDRLEMMQQLGLVTLPPAPSAAADRYYELRIYSVTADKMDGVLERFRETVEPVRQKYGIETIGYWMAPETTTGGTFAYLLAARSKEDLAAQEKAFSADPQFKKGYAANGKKFGKTVDGINSLPLTVDASAKFDFASAQTPRAFDLRIYSVVPGKLDAFRDRWRDYAVPIYERHGLHSIGWWVAEAKDGDGHEQFVCLLAGDSLDAIQKAIAEFHADPEWQRVEKETEQGGKLRSGVTAYKLQSTDFSRLR